MEPKIYKPGAYNTPGVYKGAGGIYNGRGVYKIGVGSSNKIKIGSIEYTFVQINNKLWTAENFREPIENVSKNTGVEKYGYMYSKDAISIIEGLLHDGWRIANSSDWNELVSYNQASLRDPEEYAGSTNTTGLSLVRSGWYTLSSDRFYNGSGRTGRYKIKGNNNTNAEIANSSIIIQNQSSWGNGDYWINMRFCKNV